jgi:hypothetical protein
MVVIVSPGSPRHEEQMQALGEFCGLDKITYQDLGDGENYILEKDGKEIAIAVRGNRVDGGFMCVNFGQPPATWKSLEQGD